MSATWHENNFWVARFEIFTAVIMKNAVFWGMASCNSSVNRRFGGTHRLHLQGRKIREPETRWLQTQLMSYMRFRDKWSDKLVYFKLFWFENTSCWGACKIWVSVHLFLHKRFTPMWCPVYDTAFSQLSSSNSFYMLRNKFQFCCLKLWSKINVYRIGSYYI
jgi:hypothetical protein